jgi:hypothetical protein
LLQDLTWFFTGAHDYMMAYMFVCMMVIYGLVMKDYLRCMVLILEFGLMHFLLKNNVGYDSEVMALWL